MKSLTPWRPTRELETFERRMSDLVEHFFGPWQRQRFFWDTEGWAPAIDSAVENGNLVVKADLPGIDPTAVSIAVLGNQLTIEGERKRAEKKEEKESFYQEVAYGKFSRTIPLPDGVDAEKVKAHYKNGVLEITLPAPKQLASKKVPIEVQ